MTVEYYNDLCAKAHPSIANAELSVRSLRCLLAWRPDITLMECGTMSETDLMRVKGLGRKSVREIKEAYVAFLSPTLFKERPKETKMEEYARRTAEALEGILAEMRKPTNTTPMLSADDLHTLSRGR